MNRVLLNLFQSLTLPPFLLENFRQTSYSKLNIFTLLYKSTLKTLIVIFVLVLVLTNC